MTDPERLHRIAKELEAYHDESLCGYCRKTAATLHDTVANLAETEDILRKAMESKLKHPGATQLPEVYKQSVELRRLAWKENAPPRQADRPLRGFIRDLRLDMRPGILRPNPPRRADQQREP